MSNQAESMILQRERVLTQRESLLAQRETALGQREDLVAQREKAATEKLADLVQREQAIGRRESELLARESNMAKWEEVAMEEKAKMMEACKKFMGRLGELETVTVPRRELGGMELEVPLAQEIPISSPASPLQVAYVYDAEMCWSSIHKHSAIDLDATCLTAKRKSDGPVASVMGSKAFPSEDPKAVAYFEVLVVRQINNHIAIGLSWGRVEGLNIWCGYRLNQSAIGYHGDGNIYVSPSHMNLRSEKKYTTGDVVGCGFDRLKNKYFFTKNGDWVGDHALPASTDIPKELYAMATISRAGEIRANFGPDFKFSLTAENLGW